MGNYLVNSGIYYKSPQYLVLSIDKNIFSILIFRTTYKADDYYEIHLKFLKFEKHGRIHKYLFMPEIKPLYSATFLFLFRIYGNL
jgi:hypothetical protein